MTLLKKLMNKWLKNYSTYSITMELIIMISITLFAVPVFNRIVFMDYDSYTDKKSTPLTAVFNEKKFKQEMLEQEVTSLREDVLQNTDNFSSILYCEDEETEQKIQSNLEYNLNGSIGVLLINKNNDKWYSNRNWFLDYPYNQLSPKDALIKLSQEDDVLLYYSSDITHYISSRGYYNGAYTPPVDDMEEIYFIRGDNYTHSMYAIKVDFFTTLPMILILILLAVKHIIALKKLKPAGYIKLYENILLLRTLRAFDTFVKNFYEIVDQTLLCRTVVVIMTCWCIYIPLYIIHSSYAEYYYSPLMNIWSVIFITVVAVLLNIIVSYIENVNNKNKLIKFIKKVIENDLDATITPEKLGNLSELGSEINRLKSSYNENIEAGIKNERLKTELITNVSHDLKTPLTSIINYVDILKDEHLTREELTDYIAILDNKSVKLKKLVEDLFEMSKMSSGQIELNKTKIDMVELIHQSLGELSFLGDDNHLTFKVTGITSCMMSVDGARMSRVMDNLICNAIKYSLENSRIFIDISKDTDNAVIIIKNISKYELDFDESEILERFARGDKSRNSSTEGSGLGLAIASSIVELHGGMLKVKCDGDLFKVIITLPLNIAN